MNPATDRSSRPLHRRYTDRTTDSGPLGPLDLELALSIYRFMLLSRLSDEAEAGLVARGEAGFHLACAGHETLACLASLLTPDDWLHLHYRDKALVLARGVPVVQFLHDLLASEHSSSLGRQMFPFLSDRSRHLLAQNVPVGNHTLQAVGVAAAIKHHLSQPIVLCTLGDGATQQGEFLEAVAEAVRSQLPVLFLIEDNRYAISTHTAGRTFYSLPDPYPTPSHLFGLPLHRVDGRDPVLLHAEARRLIHQVRSHRGPALAILQLDRLCNHTNADDERVYRQPSERSRAQAESDPLLIFEHRLKSAGVLPQQLAQLRAEVQAELDAAVSTALLSADPAPICIASRPLPHPQTDRQTPSDGPPRTMLEAIRDVLRHRLETDPLVLLHGQDIEDPKGDVFGVTRGLSTAFPGRVLNAPLAESTIVGTAIGRALAGQRPVAFLQFADFLPVAFNQIASELGSLWWRTAGDWDCPVILMIACGGFRPGLGPFHSQTMEALLAHIPGIDVLMPSSADDAAGLLNAAFDSRRPTAFLYPKSCLNDPERATRSNPSTRLLPIGLARKISEGNDLTLITWGATVPHAERASSALAELGVGVDLIDLRSISPWDIETVVASAQRSGRLLIAHEDNLTCGFGAEVLATVSERLPRQILARRVTRPDTYIPCNYSNQLEILPSFRRILSAAAEMLQLHLSWDSSSPTPLGELTPIEARGPSPADQNVKVLDWLVRPGALVKAGDPIAEMEADKAVFEFVSPISGTVSQLLVPTGQSVRVGTPLALVASSRKPSPARLRSASSEPKPRLLRPDRLAQGQTSTSQDHATHLVALSVPTTALGSLVVSSDEIASRFPDRSADDILKRTGIEARRCLAPGESALSLGVLAARQALERAALDITQIDALICSTTTPQLTTPSMACLLLHQLSQGRSAPPSIPAYDLLAACSGYLYALGAAHDLLRARPGSRILVVTAEALSSLANPDDFDTAILFGDAATATLVTSPDAQDQPLGLLHRPILSARGEPGQVLRVPTPGNGFVRMEGLKVYAEAVRNMIDILEQACQAAGRSARELDLIVPHQANARIITDIQKRLNLPAERVCFALQHVGNTSSSSIPLALSNLNPLPARVGLTTFGGGYTFAAALLDRP